MQTFEAQVKTHQGISTALEFMDPMGTTSIARPAMSGDTGGAVGGAAMFIIGGKLTGFVDDIATKATKHWSAFFKSEGEARALARTKLGTNPVLVGPGKLRSADGKWQYRAKPGDVADRHIHLEELDPETGEVIQNVHLLWGEGGSR